MTSKNVLAACTGDERVGISTPNISYQTARASAQAGQSTTTRNIVVNGTQAVGLIMAGFTPYFLNNFNKSRWATGPSIVGTPLAQAINLVAPDQTIREINNLDDQAFRDGKLIPNNTRVRMLVFVQKKSVAESNRRNSSANRNCQRNFLYQSRSNRVQGGARSKRQMLSEMGGQIPTSPC